MRFLAFDCLVVDGENMMSRPLDKRYGVRVSRTYFSLANASSPAVTGILLQPVRENEEGPSPGDKQPPFRVGSLTRLPCSRAHGRPVYESSGYSFHTPQSWCLRRWPTCNTGATDSFIRA
jgi:hypothetical protein